MIYYNENGEEIYYGVSGMIKKGTQGTIFRLENNSNMCLKQYFDEDDNKTIFDDCGQRFTKDMFCYFRDVFNHPNFCKLDRLLYDEKTSKILAYTMKYYEESEDNILLFPIDYIVDNFKLLYEAIDRLTDDGIRVVGLNAKNMALHFLVG